MKHWWLVALVAAACTDTGVDSVSDGADTRQQTLTQVSPSAADLSYQLERQAKAEWTGEVAPQRIDWPEAKQHDPIASGVLSDTQMQAVAKASLPVLLPGDAALASSAFVTSGDLWYGADLQADGIHVFVHGSRGARPNDLKLTPEQTENLRNFTIYRSHEIVTLTFQMYGAAYRIDVECDRPTADDRCNKDAFVTSMAESMVFAGGRP